MKYLVLIQARCGSSRLPNKVLLDLAGKPDIVRVVERVKRSKYVEETIVITSIDTNNLPLIRICSENGIRVFVGSENDVLDRYYQAARLFKPEYVIRITADCPVIDWRYIDMMIEIIEEDTDYISDLNETFPDGLDVEIIKYDALRKAWSTADLSSEREHVTLYIKNHPESFVIKNYKCPIDGISYYRLTLDEEADYELLSHIYDYFFSIGKEYFITEDIIDLLQKNPEWKTINNHIERNEGLKKSLFEDQKIKVIE